MVDHVKAYDDQKAIYRTAIRWASEVTIKDGIIRWIHDNVVLAHDLVLCAKHLGLSVDVKACERARDNETLINGKSMAHVELGELIGIGLDKRGVDDFHVCYTVLVEDDGMWYPSNSIVSSHWIEELSNVTQRAIVWMQENCDPDPAGGWKFRPSKEM